MTNTPIHAPNTESHVARAVDELLFVERLAEACDLDAIDEQFLNDCAEVRIDIDALIEDYDGDVISAWLEMTALEISVLVDVDDPHRTRVEILCAYGGPHRLLVRDSYDGDYIVVTGDDGVSQAGVKVLVPRIAEHFNVIASYRSSSVLGLHRF
jgi:hypothetical protein